MERYLVTADKAAADTDKLDDAGYLRTADHFLGYLYASSTALNVTAICCLRLIYENSPERFERLLIKSGHLFEKDEYRDMTFEMLLFCSEELYRRYLESAAEKGDEEILEEPENADSETESCRSRPWYKNMQEEYAELKRQLAK